MQDKVKAGVKWLSGVLADELNQPSSTRLAFVLAVSLVVGGTGVLTIQAGAPVEIPPSWRELLIILGGLVVGNGAIKIGHRVAAGKIGDVPVEVDIQGGLMPAPPPARDPFAHVPPPGDYLAPPAEPPVEEK